MQARDSVCLANSISNKHDYKETWVRCRMSWQIPSGKSVWVQPACCSMLTWGAVWHRGCMQCVWCHAAKHATDLFKASHLPCYTRITICSARSTLHRHLNPCTTCTPLPLLSSPHPSQFLRQPPILNHTVLNTSQALHPRSPSQLMA